MKITSSNGGDVAIIGAGIAGLAAAHVLVERGLRVRLFDKARGPAGRISTRHAPGFDFDHGAQYFTARDESFRTFVKALEEREVVAEWKGAIARIDGSGRDVGRAKESQRFVGRPGMNSIAKHLALNLDVVTRTRVAPLTEDSPTSLRDESGEELGVFERVLVTLPAEQAAELVVNAEPSLSRIAGGVAMKPCRALLLGFEERVEAPFDGAFVEDSPLSWIARNSSKPGRPGGEAWVLHASGEWSEEHFLVQPEAAGAVLESGFREICGGALPPIVHRDSHRWKYAIPERVLESSFIAGEKDRIVLCGDWCAGPRVEGAWLSGRAAASRILAAIS